MRFGFWEILILLSLVLLFFGPKRLPGLGQSLGSAIRNFKRGIGGEADEAKQLQAGGSETPAEGQSNAHANPQAKA